MLMSHNLLHILVKIFALVFSVFIIQCSSRHEQVCLTRLPFERYFSYHRAWWREKYLSTSSLIKDAYSWRDKLLYIAAYTVHIKLQQEITKTWLPLWTRSDTEKNNLCLKAQWSDSSLQLVKTQDCRQQCSSRNCCYRFLHYN